MPSQRAIKPAEYAQWLAILHRIDPTVEHHEMHIRYSHETEYFLYQGALLEVEKALPQLPDKVGEIPVVVAIHEEFKLPLQRRLLEDFFALLPKE